MNPAAPDFRLDEVTHTYFLGDRILPGTTGLLKAAGLIDSTWYNEAAMIRGNAVHAACHYRAEGDLHWTSLDPGIHGYVEAYEKAVEGLDFTPLECEKIFMHPIYKYGTKPDQIGSFSFRAGILELKSGVMQDWTALQTAFQAMAIWPTDFFNKIRLGLELHPDGTYRAVRFDDSDDFVTAAGIYQTWAWKQKHMKGEIKNGN